MPVLTQPIRDRFIRRNGWQADRLAERRVCKVERRDNQFWQGAANRFLADQQVVVVGLGFGLFGRHHDTGAQPHANQAEQRGDFVFIERSCGVVMRGHQSSDDQRIVSFQDRVGNCNCQVGDGPGMHGIAKINQPAD